MTGKDIINWPVEFGAIDAAIKCRPIDAKLIANAPLPQSAAVLGINDAGVWIRSGASHQGTHAHCPAEAFPEFECVSAGAVVVYPSHLTTLRSATLSTDTEQISVSLCGERMTMRADGFGGTVPTIVPDRDAGQHQRIADLDLCEIHDRHTAEARVVDWKFEDFLDMNTDRSDSELTLSPDNARITTQSCDARWRWEESAGSGEATYRGQEFREVFDRFYQLETTPHFAWGDNETVAMSFRGDGWQVIGYVTPLQNASTGSSETTERRCPTCGGQLERASSTGNWSCESPTCGFRSIKLE